MRRSAEVQLTLLAAVALSVMGCRSERRDCIDAQGHLIPDGACHVGGGMGYIGPHYIYGGSSGGHMGDYVIGGHATPRGGFGGTFGGSHISSGGE